MGNENHLRMMANPRWAQMLRQPVLPWLESVGGLGDDGLEIGPGPGLTTELLLTPHSSDHRGGGGR